jgi:dephospho-CoA kinase
MDFPHIIAICGKKRSGKDTLADYLVQRYGYTKISFADPLKKVVQIVFGFTDDEVNGHEKDLVHPDWGFSPRQALQFVGTELFQYKIQELSPSIERTLWAKALIREIQKNETKKYVISDLRFLHEYKALQETFADRMLFLRVKRNLNSDDTHLSENEEGRIPVHFELKNESTVEALHQSFEHYITT